MLNQIDLNRLRVFALVYSLGNTVDAAKELRITRSAVSQHLSKLEDELGVSLFVRMHKRLVPTMEAERLSGSVLPFLRGLEDDVAFLVKSAEAPAGRLRVGAPIEFGKRYLPPLMAGFRRQYPQVSFSVELGNPGFLLDEVRSGKLDMAYVDVFLNRWLVERERGIFAFDPVFDEEMVLVASREYYESVLGGRKDYETLKDAAFIAYKDDALELRTWFEHHFGRTPKRLTLALVVDNFEAVLGGVRCAMGLGILAPHLIRDELMAGSLVQIGIRDEIANRVSLVQLQEKVPNLLERTFSAYVRDKLPECGGDTVV